MTLLHIFIGRLLGRWLNRPSHAGPLDEATTAYRVRSWSGWAIIMPMLVVAVLAGWVILDVVT